MQLTAQGEKIREHWEKFRPKMYAELQKSGQLESSIQKADELTSNQMGELVEKGVPHNQAWEMTREQWAFLPAESDRPHLGEQQPDSHPPINE